MIAVQKTTAASSKCTPNLLPCRVQRDGPVNASTMYWSPESDQDGKTETYFRGRKMKGKAVVLPDGFRGAIVKGGAQPLQSQEQADRTMRDLDLEPESTGDGPKILEEVGNFDQLMVWGHEATPESDDPFVKGVAEWIDFARSMHSYEGPLDKGVDRKDH